MDAEGADVLSTLLALSALASGLVLAGCGAAETLETDDVAAAADRTAATGSSRVEAVTESGDARLYLDGVVDYAQRKGSFTAGKSESGRDYQDASFRVVGDTVYIDAALYGLEGRKEAGRPWVAVDLDELEPTLESIVLPFPYIDPAHVLDALFEVSGTAEREGGATVRGVPTDHYRLTIDLERVVETAPARHRAGLRADLAAQAEKTQPLELWIDDDGLVRRLRFPDPEETTTLEFYDFGVDVDVEAPPEDQVSRGSDLVPRGEADYGTTDDDEEGK